MIRLFIITIFIVILVFVFKYRKKIKIYWQSFKYKSTPQIDDQHGVYLIHGKQGSNKSYFATQFVLQQNKKFNKIKTNVKSLHIPGYEIEYFTKLDEIVFDTDDHVIYVIDEISRKFKKEDKTSQQFYAWLNQSRKRKRIVILITQELKEVPMWLRRPVRFTFETKPLFFGIFYTLMGDGYNLTLNKDTLEWEAPILKIYVYKRNQYIASMYDTFEPIQDL